MTTPATSEWLQRAHVLNDQLNTLCTDLAALPIEERLAALAHLDHALTTLTHQAVREGAIAARTLGWSLRRIGTHLHRSHEQIRILTTPDATPALNRQQHRVNPPVPPADAGSSTGPTGLRN
ncbi:hypothetical protein ACIQ1S_23775 [Streptomyces griseus]|uniref:hypothetical protein n=1 Tax=Streptomyces griseus TaxID=1911 RepID=UPI0037F1B4EF